MTADRERRDYRLLLVGGTTSIIGTQVTAVALPLLLISNLTTSALALSLVAVARYLPFIVLSVPVGALADRRDPLALMFVADVSRLVFMAAIPVLYFADLLTVPVVILLVLATATGRVLFDLSAAKLVVLRFRRTSWLRVNAGLDTAANTGELVGPSLAGALASLVGAAWALVLDSVSYLVSLATVVALRRERRERPTPAAGPAPAGGPSALSPRSAVQLIWRHTTLRYLVLGTALQNFALMAGQAIALLYLVDDRQLSGVGAGLVISALGVGSIAGAAAAPALATRLGLLPAVALSAPVAAVGPLSLLLSGSTWAGLAVALTGYALLGGSLAMTNAFSRRYRQEVVPVEVFGRVSGVYSTLLMGMLPIGALAGGVVGDALGLTAALLLSGAAFAVAGVLVVLAVYRGRASSSTSSDPAP